MSDAEQAESLMKEAYGLLERMEFDRAIEVGEALKSLNHSSAFDVLAEAHAGKGQPEKAIAILEEGVKTVPNVWLLWQFLGNLRAQMGDFERAHEAFGRALVCHHVDRSTVHFNRALAYARQNDYGEALACLRLVDSEPLIGKARSFMVAVLVDLGRLDEAADTGRPLLASLTDPEDLARVHAHLSRASLTRGATEEARESALAAIRALRWEPAAMYVLRQIENRTSDASSYYRLMIEGHEADGRPFMGTYDVVADSPEKAFEYVRAFEPNEVTHRDTRIIDRRTGVLHGVYGMTNHVAVTEQS